MPDVADIPMQKLNEMDHKLDAVLRVSGETLTDVKVIRAAQAEAVSAARSAQAAAQASLNRIDRVGESVAAVRSEVASASAQIQHQLQTVEKQMIAVYAQVDRVLDLVSEAEIRRRQQQFLRDAVDSASAALRSIRDPIAKYLAAERIRDRFEKQGIKRQTLDELDDRDRFDATMADAIGTIETLPVDQLAEIDAFRSAVDEALSAAALLEQSAAVRASDSAATELEAQAVQLVSQAHDRRHNAAHYKAAKRRRGRLFGLVALVDVAIGIGCFTLNQRSDFMGDAGESVFILIAISVVALVICSLVQFSYSPEQHAARLEATAGEKRAQVAARLQSKNTWFQSASRYLSSRTGRQIQHLDLEDLESVARACAQDRTPRRVQTASLHSIQRLGTSLPPPPNSSQKLSRPGAGPPAEPACQHTRMGGVTSVADRQSWLRNSSAATVVPRRLRHVGPGRAA
jgi:hypothetical protein